LLTFGEVVVAFCIGWYLEMAIVDGDEDDGNSGIDLGDGNGLDVDGYDAVLDSGGRCRSGVEADGDNIRAGGG